MSAASNNPPQEGRAPLTGQRGPWHPHTAEKRRESEEPGEQKGKAGVAADSPERPAARSAASRTRGSSDMAGLSWAELG